MAGWFAMQRLSLENQFMSFFIQLIYGMSFVVASISIVYAAPSLEDPRQSIRFWKQYTIHASENENVALAQEIFQQLLRTWNHKHRFIPPKLYVVESDAGPWAASLADGDILLSKAALKLAGAKQSEYKRDYLAFILAHELAHQQNDDMWHLKFFRLAGSQTPETRKLMLSGLSIDKDTIVDLENREAKADEDAIVLMSMVGFDPHNILGDNNFFTHWAENIWNATCYKSEISSAKTACDQAKARTHRTRAKLQSISDKSLLFDLGVQAFVEADYAQARNLFSLFEREYSSYSVLDNIGLTYIAEILSLKSKVQNSVKLPQTIQFYYPIMLDISAFDTRWRNSLKRSVAKRNLQESNYKSIILENTEKAIPLFERAIKINPNYEAAYIHLSISYLLQNNTYMARGILQGKYMPRFGEDKVFQLLLSLTMAIEDKSQFAIKNLEALIHETPPQQSLLLYAMHYNLAKLFELSGQKNEMDKTWKSLLKSAKKAANGSLFQLALTHLKGQNTLKHCKSEKLSLSGLRINQILAKNLSVQYGKEVWMDGELYHFIRLENGQSVVLDKQQKVLNAWQSQHPKAGEILKLKVNDSADRVIKTLGVPHRQVLTQKGLYLAYDKPGIGFNIKNEKIAGWFLYQ